MKHYSTFGKFNFNYKDPIIPRINKIKSKKILSDIKQYNNINTLSLKKLIDPEIKMLSKSINLNAKIRRNTLNYLYKRKNKTHSYSSIFNRKINNGFSEKSIKTKKNNKKIYHNLNYIENLKKKIKSKNRNNFDIFYKKENILFIKSFNTINNQIRKNINENILNVNYPLYNNRQLNEKAIHKNNFIFKNNLSLSKNNIDNNLNKKKKKNKVIFELNRIYIESLNKRNLSNFTIKNKKPLNSINSRICFPYYFKDNMIMDNYSNKNLLEYKKYIETQ